MAAVLDRLRDRPVDRPVVALLAVWTLVMIALPIVRAVADVTVFNTLVVASVAIQAAAVLLILSRSWGVRQTLLTAAMLGFVSWGIEALGSSTGFPFGAYDYTNSLQPQVLGVPLVIPLAWLMMLPPAWAVAQILLNGRRPAGWVGQLSFILLSAAAFTAWDLFLDPQMVSWGYWIWETPRGYFGIPWVNYLGWLLASSLLTAAARPGRVPEPPLLFVYTLTWALESIGLVVFFGLAGPGLVGFAVMGVFVLLAWRRFLQSAAIPVGNHA